MNIDIEKIRDARIDRVHDVQVTHVKGVEIEHVKDVEVEHVRHISPVAAHIKEINHIDPVSVDAFHVTEIRNVEPLRVAEFNVTNLPNVNISLRQMPAVDINLRRIPPLSLGLHQTFQIPSSYLVRFQLLGFELFRMALQGQSEVIAHERYRREQSRTHDRSQPLPAVAGNPGIPSRCQEVGASEMRPNSPGAAGSFASPSSAPASAASGGLDFAGPKIGFSLPIQTAQTAETRPADGAGHIPGSL